MKKYVTLLPLVITFGSLTAQEGEFKPSGKFSGQVFADLQYKASSPDSTNLRTWGSKAQYAFANGYDNNYSSFEFRRIYLGYEYNFSQKFTAQVLLSHEGNLDASGNRTVFVKVANIRWKNIFKGSDAIFGQQQTPTFATFTEVVYGCRFAEKTIADMRGLASSNDMGLGLQGKYKDGMVGYEALVGNDNGGKPENDNFKRFYGNVWTRLLGKRLVIDLYSDYVLTQLSPNGPGLNHSTKSKSLSKAFIAWQQEQFTVGAEVLSGTWKNYAYTKDTATVNPKPNDTTDVKSFGVSFFAKVNLLYKKGPENKIPVVALFVRYDMYNPDTGFNPALKYSGINNHISETFYIVGVDYMPMPQLHVMPNIWVNSYTENAPLNDTRGKPLKGVQSSGSDVDYRLTFFWKF